MNAAATSDRHIRWPADRFYWAQIDASVLPKTLVHRGPDTKRLGFLFEAVLPVSIDRVQACYVPLGGRHYLACGVDHERLATDLPRNALTLSPDSIPAGIAGDREIDARSINLLTGAHEPAPVRRERRRYTIESAALAALVVLALVLGMERRIDALDRGVETIRQRRHSIHTELYGPGAAASVQPPSVRLLAELRHLERTHHEATTSSAVEPPRADATLTSLLSAWPRAHPVRTESISVTPTSITLIGLLPDADGAQAFISAFPAPPEWDANQPQIGAVGDGVRLTWRWQRRSASAPTVKAAEERQP